jgi:hypothetical protein
MKNLIYLSFLVFFSPSCGERKDKLTVDMSFSNELNNLKEKCIKKFNSDVNRNLPYRECALGLDKEFSKFDGLANRINDTTALGILLLDCQNAINKLNQYVFNNSTRKNITEELDYLIANKSKLSLTTLKEHLQFIQFIYWTELEREPFSTSIAMDTVGIMFSDSVGKSGKPFSTIIIPVGLSTTLAPVIITGEGFSRDGKLFGKIDTIKTKKNHMPFFQTSHYNKGLNIIPAQRVMSLIDGTVVRNNFYIKFNIQ